MEIAVFLIVFVITGLIATSSTGITETLPILYLLKWSVGLFFTMLPCAAMMWAVIVFFEKPLFSVGLNLLFVIPSVLIANTPLWVVYPYCYSGYLVSCSLHKFTAEGKSMGFQVLPFLPCALLIFTVMFTAAVVYFKKKEYQ